MQCFIVRLAILSKFRSFVLLTLGLFSLYAGRSYAQINAAFSVNKGQGCSPLVVFFENTSSGDYDECYWDFGNGNQSVECNPIAIYSDPGDYTARLTVRKGGQSSTVSGLIKVFFDPVPSFEVSTDKGCFPLAIQFLDQSAGVDAPVVSYVWDFGNGRNSSLQNPVQTYTASGEYVATLVVTDANGCKGFVERSEPLSIVAKPEATFEFSDGVACDVPFEVQFIDGSFSVQPLTYLWSFGDGASSTEKNPLHIYSNIGTYDVRLEIENEYGCKDDTTISGTISIETAAVEIKMDSVACAPLQTSFSAISNVQVVAYQWDFGNGLMSNAATGDVLFETPGIYQVTLTVTSVNGCTASATKTIRVGATPVVDFTADVNQSCTTPLTVQFLNQTLGASGFSWNLGGGVTSTLENPVRTYTQPGRYNVRLTVVTDEGCSASLVKPAFIVIENPAVSIVADQDAGCVPLSSTFSLNVLGPGTPSGVQWNFGNGNTFSGLNPPAQTFNTMGSYTISAVVNFVEGCVQQTVTKEVVVGDLPVFSGTISPASGCASAIFSGQATGGAPGTQYVWNMGNGQQVQGENLSYQYSRPGTYTVTLKATNNGCSDSVFVRNVVINPPLAEFSVANICGGETVSFRNQSIGSNQSIWYFGDGSAPLSSNAGSITHTYTGLGVFQVKLVVTNITSGCSDSIVKTIQLRDPVSNFNLIEQKGCTPFTAAFTNPNPALTSVQWDFGDTIVASFTAEYQYSSPGAFTVKVYTEDALGCRDTFSFVDIVKSVRPVASFSNNPVGGCAPINISFTDSSKSAFSTIVSWSWDFGGLGSSTLSNPSFTFNQSGNVRVRLVVADDLGCTDGFNKQIPIVFPIADFTSRFNSICTGVPFKFDNASSGVAPGFIWDFGDGSPPSFEENPFHTYAAEGTYTVTLVMIDANDCRDSISKTAFLTVENFNYDFSADRTYKSCPELFVNFAVSPADITYNSLRWDFGNGNRSLDTLRFPTNIYARAGVFSVSLILEDYRGCQDIVSKPNLIKVDGPRVDFTLNPSQGCVPLEVNYTPQFFDSPKNVYWDFGDGNGLVDTNFQTNITHLYESPGSATPALVAEDSAGCVVVIKAPAPVLVSGITAAIELDADTICFNQLLTLKDISTVEAFDPVAEWDWDLGDGSSSSVAEFEHLYSNSEAAYTVSLKVITSFGCIDSSSTELTVLAIPNVVADGDKLICEGDQVMLSVTGATAYEWTPAESLSDPFSANPMAGPAFSTTYVVRGFVISGCEASDTVIVTVTDRVRAVAGPDGPICKGDSVQLFVDTDEIASGAFSYVWSPVETLSDPTISNPIARPDVDIIYSVLVSNGNCIPSVGQVFVTVSDYPQLNVVEEYFIVKGGSERLEVYCCQDVDFEWSPTIGLSCSDCPNPIAGPDESIVYTVKATNEAGCSVSELVRVTVLDRCDDSLLEMPNTFTPNNDGINDFFKVRGKGISRIDSFVIYNRMGQRIFESFDIGKGWDGTYNGVQLNSGVYVYMVEAQCSNGDTFIAKGNITLLR